MVPFFAEIINKIFLLEKWVKNYAETSKLIVEKIVFKKTNDTAQQNSRKTNFPKNCIVV